MNDSPRPRLRRKKECGHMGKSARVLGWEFGRTSREMNALLKQHGYLDGTPGAYGLTEKGQQYAQEQYHSRGTGGYAHYNRSWETRTWNDETTAALKADMQASPRGVDNGDSPYVPLPVHTSPDATDENAADQEPVVPVVVCGCSGDDDPPPSWAELAVVGAVVGALCLAPHIKPFWNNTVKPATKKLRNRLTKQQPVESTDSFHSASTNTAPGANTLGSEQGVAHP
jgi:hypothetical protein